jgi:hypothetical protein
LRLSSVNPIRVCLGQRVLRNAAIGLWTNQGDLNRFFRAVKR